MKPVYVDGLLYVLIGLFGAMEATFNDDTAYKYFNPYVLYFCKNIIIWCLAIVSALKMFRSTTFSDHLEKQKVDLAKQVGDTKTTVTETKTNETKIDTQPAAAPLVESGTDK